MLEQASAVFAVIHEGSACPPRPQCTAGWIGVLDGVITAEAEDVALEGGVPKDLAATRCDQPFSSRLRRSMIAALAREM
jgi:hypothetical protein